MKTVILLKVFNGFHVFFAFQLKAFGQEQRGTLDVLGAALGASGRWGGFLAEPCQDHSLINI